MATAIQACNRKRFSVRDARTLVDQAHRWGIRVSPCRMIPFHEAEFNSTFTCELQHSAITLIALVTTLFVYKRQWRETY